MTRLPLLLLLLLCAPALGQGTFGTVKIIDYTNGDELDGATGVVDGGIQYHMQWPGLTNRPAGFEGNTLAALNLHLTADEPDTPDNGFLLFDSEPWTVDGQDAVGDYEDNGQAANLTLFSAYAETIFHYGQPLRRR